MEINKRRDGAEVLTFMLCWLSSGCESRDIAPTQGAKMSHPAAQIGPRNLYYRKYSSAKMVQGLMNHLWVKGKFCQREIPELS
jgi:hypothetical protein